MNKNNNWIAVVIIAILVVAVVVMATRGPKEEVSIEQSATGSAPNKNVSAPNPIPKPIPPNTLVLSTPIGGEIYRVGEMLSVSWDSSVDLSSNNTKMIIKLMRDGKVITTLTETGGAPAGLKKFTWKVQNMSAWGEQGFSVQITTTGLTKNLAAESSPFTIVKP